jgi:CRISPR-associated protein (TIGR02710 family)
MAKALVISVGGTVDPITKSVREHRPDFVCFYASQDTVGTTVPKVIDKLKAAGISPRTHYLLVDDPEDIVHCYEKAIAMSKVIADEGFQPEDVMVDYTGGTKTMSAALALASVGKGYSFSYVGGTERTKEGVGVVVSGTEVVRSGVSPWQLFAVEEKRRLAIYFNSHQFAAAIESVEGLCKRIPPETAPAFQLLKSVIEGYQCWDQFQHKKALEKFVAARETIKGALPFIRSADETLAVFFERARQDAVLLHEMKRSTGEFKSFALQSVEDLLSNAERRADEGKYDDAVARLYRALEMIGQMAFEKKLGVKTDEVPIDKIPSHLQEEYQKRFFDQKSGTLKLSLDAVFRVLKSLGHDEGKQYIAHEEDIKQILSARNYSILAHGSNPVKKETYDNFAKLLREIFKIEERVIFPKLEW